VSADLVPSDTRTWCPYKGGASSWSLDLGDSGEPLPDAAELGGCGTFSDERVDVVVDGVPRQRPVTPWS
jgi:uncharacterized protein (DUF427 family)